MKSRSNSLIFLKKDFIHGAPGSFNFSDVHNPQSLANYLEGFKQIRRVLKRCLIVSSKPEA